MRFYRVNPLSYVTREALFFQSARQTKELKLRGRVRDVLSEFFHSPTLAPRRVPGRTELAPLIDIGAIWPADEVLPRLKKERDVFGVPGDTIFLLLRALEKGLSCWWLDGPAAPRLMIAPGPFSRRWSRNIAVWNLDSQLFLNEPDIAPIADEKSVTSQLLRARLGLSPVQLRLGGYFLQWLETQPRRDELLLRHVSLHWPTRITFPIVVKPSNLSFGIGVHIANGAGELGKAVWDIRRRHVRAEDHVLIEQKLQGIERRVTLIGDEVFVLRRCPLRIVGDGKRSIRELIEQEFTNRRLRYKALEFIRRPPKIDVSLIRRLLAKRGLTDGERPGAGECIRLTEAVNAACGGTVIGETLRWPGKTLENLVRIGEGIGGSRMGFDLIGPPSRLSGRPCILEINAHPQLYGHEEPDFGPPQPAAWRLLSRFLVRGLSPSQVNILHEEVSRVASVFGKRGR